MTSAGIFSCCHSEASAVNIYCFCVIRTHTVIRQQHGVPGLQTVVILMVQPSCIIRSANIPRFWIVNFLTDVNLI